MSEPVEGAIEELPRERVVREAIRAHSALMRYGRHDPSCPADGNFEVEATGNCDCGLDAATYSPFVPED